MRERDDASPATKPEELEDFRRLLELADSIQEHLERGQRRLWIARLVQASVVLAGFIFAFSIQSSTASSDFAAISVTLAVGIVGYVVAVDFLIRTRFSRTVNRDSRALHDITQMLREMEATMADAPVLERAEIRIRLSRYDL